jgi:hypothetical protein
MKNTLIIIPFHFIWDWPADYLRQTAMELAKHNTVFCFLGIEQIRLKEIFGHMHPIIYKKSKSLWIYRPVQIIPFERFHLIRRMNMFFNLMFFQGIVCIFNIRHRYTTKIIWICNHVYYFFPNYMCGKYKILYDCVDAISDIGNENQKISEYEENQLIQNADFMTVISHALYNKHTLKRKDISIVPQGFRLNSYKEYQKNMRNKSSHSPLLGMVGTLDNRIDYQLLYELIKNNKNWQFELWGKVCISKKNKIRTFKSLSRLQNIKICSASAERIPEIIQSFDIAIIPYDVSYAYNTYCYPMKLFEYFYMEKPVIAAPIQELKRFPNMFVLVKQ